MARIAGVTIPKDKRVVIALTYIFGIGPTLAEEILKKANIDVTVRVKDLKLDEEDRLRKIVEKEYSTEGDLRRELGSNVKRLRDIRSYRGGRHAKKLPARGQRTKVNSRTVRGNRRSTMGSGRRTLQKT